MFLPKLSFPFCAKFCYLTVWQSASAVQKTRRLKTIPLALHWEKLYSYSKLLSLVSLISRRHLHEVLGEIEKANLQKFKCFPGNWNFEFIGGFRSIEWVQFTHVYSTASTSQRDSRLSRKIEAFCVSQHETSSKWLKKAETVPLLLDTLGLGLSKKPVGLINDMNIIIIIVIIIFIIILYCYYYLNTSRYSSLFRCSGVLMFRCFCVAACSSVFQRIPACFSVFRCSWCLQFHYSLHVGFRGKRSSFQGFIMSLGVFNQNFFWSCASKLF